jgi:hypothetical protein
LLVKAAIPCFPLAEISCKFYATFVFINPMLLGISTAPAEGQSTLVNGNLRLETIAKEVVISVLKVFTARNFNF